MAITDQQYQDWLRDDRKTRVLLAEATYYPTGGPAATRYFANRAYVSRPTDTPANTAYDDIIAQTPVFVARMSEQFDRSAPAGWGDLVIANESGARDAWLDDAWDGRGLKLLLGDPSWARDDFRAILQGVSADIVAIDRSHLALRARDKEWLLNVPLQKNLVGGTTDNADRLKPLCYGECYNVEPVLIDAATHKYQVHDGAIEDIVDVRDSGLTVAYAEQVADGTFTLSAAPAGRITADVKGAKPGGVYLTAAADIIEDIWVNRMGLSSAHLDATSFGAFATACPQTLGLYVAEYMSGSTAVDEILASVGGFRSWGRDGTLYLGRLEEPSGTADLELTADDIGLNGLAVVRRVLPVKVLRLGWRRNWTVQRDGLAGAVTEANRAAFGRAWRTKKATNAGADTMHALARHPAQIPTLLVDGSDAQDEVDRRAALWASLRYIYEARAYAAPMTLRIGQEVQLTHPRFGFAGGRNAIIVGFREDPNHGKATLELFA